MQHEYLDMLQVTAQPAELIETFKRYIPSTVDRWAEKRDII
jgi:hypothetical protein